MSAPRVLIVVPTLGDRLAYLEQCLASVAAQDMAADILVVAPPRDDVLKLADRFGARMLPDPGGLPAAINAGVAAAKDHHEFVNWIGDDDLLEPGSLAATTAMLDSNPEAVVAYGACRYIDGDGLELWVSRAGRWADRILAWGPDLIPQPGMLVRRSAWARVAGVDESFRFAFDLDLLLKLRRVGRLVDTGTVVSCFRWHADSLTVGDRTANLAESERAKRRALGPTARRLAWLWERPIRVATRVAAAEVSRRARRIEARRAPIGTDRP